MFLFIICMENMQILNLEGLKIDSRSETTENFASKGFFPFSRLLFFCQLNFKGTSMSGLKCQGLAFNWPSYTKHVVTRVETTFERFYRSIMQSTSPVPKYNLEGSKQTSFYGRSH